MGRVPKSKTFAIIVGPLPEVEETTITLNYITGKQSNLYIEARTTNYNLVNRCR